MKRREFLGTVMGVAGALGAICLGAVPGGAAGRSALPPSELPPGDRSSALPGGPEFVEFGSPYLKSSDRIAGSGGARPDRRALREEMVHHRLPGPWRDRHVLGVRE